MVSVISCVIKSYDGKLSILIETIYSMSSAGDMQAPCGLPGAVGTVLETSGIHWYLKVLRFLQHVFSTVV